MSSVIEIEKIESFDEKLMGSSPFTSLFRNILVMARDQGASDIHFEPKFNHLLVRIRVNGDLKEIKKISKEFIGPFIFEIKRLTGMSIAKKGKVQDSRVSFPSLNMDLRGSAIPSLIDDKLVFRIIDTSKEVNLQNLEHSEKALFVLSDIAKNKNGLVILSGPTGSGKSSTLYGVLNTIDREKLNVLTIEDPVERIIDGTTPVEIKEHVSFKQALKSAMRQDPDVIFIGEIRDSETANLALEASNTGHLVITTVHANSCMGVIDRLKGLGVDHDLLKNNIRFIGAQRLIKVLCSHCRVKSNTGFIKNIKGCVNCNGSGIIGRKPILQYLTGVSKNSEKITLKEVARPLMLKGVMDYNEWEKIQ